MNDYYPNPAVEFAWPDPAESDAPLVARVHDDPPTTVPVETPAVVETVAAAVSGRSRGELVARLAESADADLGTAAERIDALVEAGVLVRDGPARREARAWLDHGWRRSLYYHLETRDRARADRSGPDGPRGTDPSVPDVPRDAGEPVPLPDPGDLPDRPLDEVMLDRRTCRSFDGTPMDVTALSTLLDAGLRPVRSARRAGLAPAGLAVQEAAWFPFVVRPVVARSPDLDPGTYRYLLAEHALLPVEADAGSTPEAVDESIRATVVNQPFVEGGAVSLLLTVDLPRYRRGRPDPGALRYAYTAVSGHLHRLVVAATAMGYGCFQSAAFDDGKGAAVAGIEVGDELLAYMLTVGTEAA